MRNLITSTLMILITATISFAQHESAATYNQKLVDFYGVEYLNDLSNNNPGALKYINHFIANGYYIEDSEKDLSQMTDINSVKRIASKANANFTLNDFQTEDQFNIVSYDIHATENKQYFRIGATSKLLVVYSRTEITTVINKK